LFFDDGPVDWCFDDGPVFWCWACGLMFWWWFCGLVSWLWGRGFVLWWRACGLSFWWWYDLLFVCLMVFNATFSNISFILWRSVLLVEETGGPRENHWPYTSHWQTLCCTPRPDQDTNSHQCRVVLGTDCIGSCKSNYHTITAMTAPDDNMEQSEPWYAMENIFCMY
jgi:hypothetical protein